MSQNIVLFICSCVLLSAFSTGINGRHINNVKYINVITDNDDGIDEVFNVIETKQEFGRKQFKRQNDPDPINETIFHDNHKYYTSRFIKPGKERDGLWFELGEERSSDILDGDISETLIQDEHRHYEIWQLLFDFPFYGHIINAVGVATGGFLSTSTYSHTAVHLTQYIAPLQADFNPSLSNDSRILVYSTNNRFTVQWDNVTNHDHESSGPFTFQVSLFPNGSIYFVYRQIPLPVSRINADDHPVEIGLADAFYYDRVFFNIRFRSIYEYSRIKLNASDELSYSAYILNRLPNCVTATECTECIRLTSISDFDCEWCPSIRRCSDGLDRHTQEWVDNGCSSESKDKCDINFFPSTTRPLTILSSFTTDSIHNTLATSIVTTHLPHINSVLPNTLNSVLPNTLNSVLPNTLNSLLPSFKHTTASVIYYTSVNPTTLTLSPTTLTLSPTTTSTYIMMTSSSGIIVNTNSARLSQSAIAGISVSVVFVIVIGALLVCFIVVLTVLIYGYKQPASKIGHFLILNRSRFKSVRFESKNENLIIDD